MRAGLEAVFVAMQQKQLPDIQKDCSNDSV